MNIFVKIASIFVIVLIGVFTAILVTSTQRSRPAEIACASDTIASDNRAYGNVIEPLMAQWVATTDNVTLSDSPPEVLALAVVQLKEIHRKMSDLDVPLCFRAAHDTLVQGEDEAINGFLGFIDEGLTSAVKAHFEMYATLTHSGIEQASKIAGLNPASSSAAPLAHRVFYRANGPAAISITYANENGDTAQSDPEDRQWTKSFEAPPGQFLYVSVQNKGQSGGVQCEITVDGVMIKQTKSQGEYVIATCSAAP